MKILFIAAAALTVLLGLAYAVFPEVMLLSWGVQSDGVAVYAARRYGIVFLGFAVMFWLARGAENSPARTAILAGAATTTWLLAVASLLGVLTDVVGMIFLRAVVLETLMAAAFTYFLVRAVRERAT